MNEPASALIQAAFERVQPFVSELRAAGWPVEVIAHTDSYALELRIDLSGLKVPVESERSER